MRVPSVSAPQILEVRFVLVGVCAVCACDSPVFSRRMSGRSIGALYCCFDKGRGKGNDWCTAERPSPTPPRPPPLFRAGAWTPSCSARQAVHSEFFLPNLGFDPATSWSEGHVQRLGNDVRLMPKSEWTCPP